MNDWYFSTSKHCDEPYQYGPFESKDDAILEAKAMDVQIAMIGKSYEWIPQVYADRVIEQAQLDADDIIGPVTNDWLNHVAKDAEAELTMALTKVFREWLVKHGHEPTFFGIEEEKL